MNPLLMRGWEAWHRVRSRVTSRPRSAADLAWLTDAWDELYPGRLPRGHLLRGGERWVRFHSLPGSKRYADDEGEYAEILRRHHAVLGVLSPPGDELLVLTSSWSASARPVRRQRSLERASPCARLWRSFPPAPDDGLVGFTHVFVDRTRNGPRALDDLLRLVADDETDGVVVTERDLGWFYLPYDGGADVIARSPQQRDALRVRFAGWLSARADGL